MKLITFWCATVVACGCTAGCAPSPVAADYGTSVKQMIANQTYDPAASQKGSPAAVKGADPAMLEQALKSLRTEKVERSKVAEPMAIEVGGRGGP